jgi:hypothetical protein
VDGTLIVFENRPALNGEDFYSRKSRYGMNTMIVCDDRKKIRYIYLGWPGCTHDARVFNNSTLSIKANDFFSHHSYLLADQIAQQTLQVLEEIGIQKVTSVVTDNAQIMKQAWDIIKEKHPQIFGNGCAAHVFNL